MKVKILSCGCGDANIQSDDIDVVVKMVHAVIADGTSDEEFDDIEDIIKIKSATRERSWFYWGGPSGDLYLVSFI